MSKSAERAAEEQYPHYVNPNWEDGATKEDVMPSVDVQWQNAEADMQRSAFIAGAAWQAEQSAPVVDREALIVWSATNAGDETHEQKVDRLIASGIVRDTDEVLREQIERDAQIAESSTHLVLPNDADGIAAAIREQRP